MYRLVVMVGLWGGGGITKHKLWCETEVPPSSTRAGSHKLWGDINKMKMHCDTSGRRCHIYSADVYFQQNVPRHIVWISLRKHSVSGSRSAWTPPEKPQERDPSGGWTGGRTVPVSEAGDVPHIAARISQHDRGCLIWLAEPQHSLLGVSLLPRFQKSFPTQTSSTAGRPIADIHCKAHIWQWFTAHAAKMYITGRRTRWAGCCSRPDVWIHLRRGRRRRSQLASCQVWGREMDDGKIAFSGG